ncbi:hypothetical protein [Lysobacter arvi]|uniref:GNAT family N-acetyltransferase n=1 Tax=Lysobacter arvi TaxID=3038776 RepID=A0ABU1CEG0_9GAMM|nr:hypothetical protein [Lysobacter arvi]MDR0182587.1 hypothetical protein [Lysobacter arvi]
MSPWWSRAAGQLHAIGRLHAQVLGAAAFVPALRSDGIASTLRLDALKAQLRTRVSPWWSRHTLWVDGYQAVSLGEDARPLALSSLHQPCDLASALTALEAVATRPAKRGVHVARVLVGAPFVHYLALPWRPLPRPADWVALARTQFIRDGMGAPDAWRFSVQDDGWGRMRLAAAVPEALCAGIGGICKARGLSLSAIEPGFAHALGRHAARIHDGRIAVVEVEQSTPDAVIAHIGFRRDGGWSGFVALPATAPLPQVLRDATVLCRQDEPEHTYVMAPLALHMDAAHWPGAQWLPLPWCPHA